MPSAGPVIVGSIKTNLGHLEAVSGLAGVMKAVLAIEKGVIPPNLNFATPNPAIDMKAWNVTVSRSSLPVLTQLLNASGPHHTDCLA
jgi:acyl transferase domain-containing protein